MFGLPAVSNCMNLLNRFGNVSTSHGFVIASIDVRDLYSGIDHIHLLEQLRAEIFCATSCHVAVDLGLNSMAHSRFTVSLLKIVVHAQIVAFDDGHWNVCQGLATGIPCGVQQADLHVNGLDCPISYEILRRLAWMAV